VVVTPGSSEGWAEPASAVELLADVVSLYAFDRNAFPRTAHRKEGRIVLPAVIPGATYRFPTQTGHKDFTAEGGKTSDWGDVSDPVLYAEEP
jgi:hypothetical protein